MLQNKNSYYLGLITEIIVMFYLLGHGYWTRYWRYKNIYGEIDLIAIHFFTKNILFIEVKSRNNLQMLYGAISKTQINRINNSAKFFLAYHSKYCKYNMRFDAAFFYKLKMQKYIKNAWTNR